jgi:hypothetical protein
MAKVGFAAKRFRPVTKHVSSLARWETICLRLHHCRRALAAAGAQSRTQ